MKLENTEQYDILYVMIETTVHVISYTYVQKLQKTHVANLYVLDRSTR